MRIKPSIAAGMFMLVLAACEPPRPSSEARASDSVKAKSSTQPHDGPVGWRTDGTSRYPDADPPLTWSDSAHVLWKKKMPSWSNASPVLVGERILTTAEPNLIVCVSASDGGILWQNAVTAPGSGDDPVKAELNRQIGDLQSQRLRLRRRLEQDENKDNTALKAEMEALEKQIAGLRAKAGPVPDLQKAPTEGSNGYASCTPVTDGSRVFVLFGSGIAAGFDLEGKQLWGRKIESPTNGWGQSSSPALAGGNLIILINKLYGLDPATGEIKWQTPSAQAWGTPVAVTIGSIEAVVTPSGQIVRADDGKELVNGLGRLNYNAPLVQDGAVYFIDGERKVLAWSLPENADAKPRQLWESTLAKDRYYSSPLLQDGLIYAINQAAMFTVLDAVTGHQVYQKKLVDLGGTVYSSICLAGGKLFVSSEGGTTVVVELGRQYKQVAVNRIESFRSTPVFTGKRMYIRGRENLYCFEKEK